MKRFWVYMIECSNGAFYTGSTPNIVRRYWQHTNGVSGAKFTRSFPPKHLACCWRFSGERGDALRAEAFIKSKGRSFKEKIISDPEVFSAMAADLFGIGLAPFSTSVVEELARSYTAADFRRGFDPVEASTR